VSAFGFGRCIADVDAEIGAGAGAGRHADRSAEALDDVLGDREAESGAALVVKYGSKMRGRSSSAMPLPVSRIVTATRRSPVFCVIRVTRADGRPRSRDRRWSTG
jgi:hypothetical protein